MLDARGPGVTAGLAVLLVIGAAPAAAARLPIAPVVQQTHVWCWVAVGEMIFRHAGVRGVNPVGNFQCGIVGLLAAGTPASACATQCELCAVPAGSAAAIRDMLEDYPRRVAAVTGRPTPRIRAHIVRRALIPGEVVDEIDRTRPIVAGISPAGRPAGGSAHVALIVGYEAGGATLIVNDPYPFPGSQNPYFAAGGTPTQHPGAYRIPYHAFQRGLDWAESFTVRIDPAAPGDARHGPPPPPAARPR